MDKGSIVRAAVLALSFLNTWLAAHGYEKIPHVDEMTVSLVITGVVAVWGFVRHNFFGKKGAEQKAKLQS